MNKKRKTRLVERDKLKKKSSAMRWALLLLFVFFSGLSANAQDTKKTVTLSGEYSVREVFAEVKKQAGYTVSYNNERLDTERRLTLDFKNASVTAVMDKVLEGTGLRYEILNDFIILSVDKKSAADSLVEVTGRVVDEKGNPIPGASVIVYGTQQGVATNSDGVYTLRVPADAVLQVSFIGYKTETMAVENRRRINVQLTSTSEDLEEVQVVAFGTQKKESVVSAITTVRPMDLKSSSSDLTTQLAGKVAGIVGWQTGGLPGALTEEEMNTRFYVRGITSFQTDANIDPLILIDGVEMSKLELARLAPEDIETFSVMKDASATAMYGARGANGVILVTTKKGEEGSVYTSVRYEAVMSMPTREIEVVDPVTYMRMYNEALLTRDPLASPRYTALDIQRREDKIFPNWAYPANDWYDILFKDYNVNHRLGINIRGGSKVVQYYASVNYVRDMGMLKTDRLNEFDVNIKNSTLSFRVNLNVNLHPQIKLLYNGSANYDKYHGPLRSVAQAYQLAFQADPVAFAPTYPADDVYNWEHIRFGARQAGGNLLQENPYAGIHYGYLERHRFSTTHQVEYIHNLSSLIKGLEVRGRVAFSETGFYSTPYETSPFFYRLESFDESTGAHTLYALSEDSGDRTISKGDETTSSKTQLNYEVRLYHTAAWKDHQTALTAVFNAQQASSTGAMTYLESIEHRNLGFSMRASYGYKDRYFVEGSFGYNGSERFAKKHKMGFFPAAGFAWVISNEPWMQGAYNWIPFLKLRGSWGKVGNDGIISSPRFVHLPDVDETTSNSQQPNEDRTNTWRVFNYPNEDIQWEVAEQVNLGLEAKMFKGVLEFTVDAYQQVRHNILAQRMTIPAHIGVESIPLDNVGKAKSQGIDFSGKIQKAFTPDFWIILNGTFTYSRAEYKELDEATDTPWWQSKIGHEISQQVGFVDQGLFRSQAEVDYAPQQNGEYALGDIRYRDINGDGVIDVEDAVHIGFPTTPRITYGFGGFVTYKNLEFSFSFQGSGRRGFFIDPVSISPFVSGRQLLKAIAEDHWTPENMEPRPFWPRLSVNGIDTHNREEYYDNSDYGEGNTYYSTYFMRECRFLRCTGLELAYNLPDTWKRALKMQNVKFFFRANNPFIISNFDLWDVELGGSGFNYPIQRTYAVGLNFSF